MLKTGTLLPGPEIGVLAAVNIARPSVVRRPRIALVGTGDELTDPGRPLRPGQIRDTNSYALRPPSSSPGRIGRTTAVRVTTELRADGWHVAPSHQDSHVLTSMLGIDAYAFVPADHESLAAGEKVDVEFVR